MAPKQLGFSKHEEEKKTVDGKPSNETSESEGSEYISDSGEENMSPQKPNFAPPEKPINESDDEESDSDSESNPKPKIMSDEEEESKEDKVISAPSKPKINPPPENTSNESDSSSDSESTAMAPPPKKPKITPHEKPSNDEEERGIAMTTPPKPSHESSYDEDSDSESEEDKAILSPAKPNKINPPLESDDESDSSSSDSESEEDKAISSPAKPNKINPPLESDDESDSSSSDSESEEDKAISSPAKPNKINPPLQKTSNESDSSSSDSESEEDTHPPKKPNLSPPKTEEEEGGRSASGFIIMPAPKPLEASKPTKMFSDEDEVALLEALAAFWANGRNNRWAEFHLSVKDHLSRPFTKTQISEKIRRLKQKFEKRARAKGGRLDISDPHESLLFELSKALWGDQKSTEENEEVGQEKAQGREKEWRALLVEELHLELKRIDLMKRDLRDHIRRLGSK